MMMRHRTPQNSRNLRDGDAVGVLLVVRLLLLGAGLAGDGAGMGGAHDRIVRSDSKDWVEDKRKRISAELRDVRGTMVSGKKEDNDALKDDGVECTAEMRLGWNECQ